MTNPSKPTLAPFKPTQEMIAAAEDLFLAMTFEQTVRPIVEAYQRKVLAERTWMVDLELQTEPGVPEYITDIKYAWLMTTEDFMDYRDRCTRERMKTDLSPENDSNYCPLLVAENTVQLARQALCNAMAPITKIDGTQAAALPVADYDQLTDLTLKVLAPFVTNPLASFKAP